MNGIDIIDRVAAIIDCGIEEMCTPYEIAADVLEYFYQPDNRWMPLEDLPERACKVFFVDGVNEVHEGLFNPKEGFTSRGVHWKTSGLRAWMPRQQLPRPPKAEA